MGSLHKNTQLILVFLKAPFLVLHFSYHTLMTFLVISVILLTMLMMLLSTLSVIGNLICGNNERWLLNLNLIYETRWHSKSMFVVEGERGVLKKRTKTKRGRGSSLSVRSLHEKDCLIFRTTNGVLSDELLVSC